VVVRSDSRATVPEPELALWIGPDLTLLGVGLGNDMTARDIEAENPLYLPQAKVWDGSCALGPWVVAWTDGDDLADVALGLEIQRRGEAAFAGAIDFAAMRRSPTELIALLGRETSFQDGVVLLTGTGISRPKTSTSRSATRSASPGRAWVSCATQSSSARGGGGTRLWRQTDQTS
jgi:2-dehydro-3-deoxy-D-arabinonate dehydratase